MQETAMLQENTLETESSGGEALGGWSYEDAFARDVSKRFDPGEIARSLSSLARENGDFDEVVEAFRRERRSTSWFFDAAEHARSTQLAKTYRGASQLRDVFLENGLSIRRICDEVRARPFGAWEFADCWPLLPYQVDALWALVEGLAGPRGVTPAHRGGRGPKAVADHAVGELRGAPATALAPAWMLFDACCLDDGYHSPIWECERMAASGKLGLTESDAKTLKALAAAPFLTDAPASPSVVAALMADDVAASLDERTPIVAASLERLEAAGFAGESDGVFEFGLGSHADARSPLEGIDEIFGMKISGASAREEADGASYRPHARDAIS